MPTYAVRDSSSGKTITLKGDSPPTEKELNDIFSQTSTWPKRTFERYGQYIPAAGATLGGIGGLITGGGVASAPFSVAGAALGGGTGEAIRQLLGRILGEPSPQTSGEAARKIGIQSALGAAGEGIGQGLGAAGGTLFKALPKIGQAMSGTPVRNIAKAQLRGFGETYFPSIAKGLNREMAGKMQGSIEDQLIYKYFKPNEIADIQLRDSRVAKNIVKKSFTKWAADKGLSVPEAFRTVKAIDVTYRDTPQGMKVAPQLTQLRRWADNIVATAHPEYKAAKRATEATILRSQLLKPFRVNKTRPDELSGFSGALGAFKPAAYLATAPFSPLAFGVGASTLGSVKRAIPPLIRKTIQRALIQAGIQTTQPEDSPLSSVELLQQLRS